MGVICPVDPNSTTLHQPEYIAILTRIGAILRRNSLPFPTKLVDGLIARLQAGEPPSILRDSNDIFGGMGSVSDYNLLSEDTRCVVGSLPSRAEREEDYKQLHRLIADLAERMCSDGIASPRVRDVGASCAIWAGDKAKACRIQPASFRVRKPTLWERILRWLRRGRS